MPRFPRILVTTVLSLVAGFDVQAATQQGSNAVVEEFFWYGCPHCGRLEPKLDTMLAARGGTVRVVRVPVARTMISRAHQRMYFALKQLGAEQRVHVAIREAITSGNTLLLTESAQATFLSARGVDPAAYRAAYESADVSHACEVADSEASAHGITAIPALVIRAQVVDPATVVSQARAKGKDLTGEDEVLGAMVSNVSAQLSDVQ
ncbi:protein dithiol oxidoreductase (disulfide-forming) (plasmid) [Pararobbsia alpina]|uniref:thioredoxin domain-containing protein n=1 Tax=Pararobbsia alpina TaxID=621374 RepID=UPI0039A72BBA